MEMFNMTHASTRERQMLFAFINCFTCTDKDITVPPTSRGPLLLSCWRIIEAAAICMAFAPSPIGPTGDLAGFQIKPFLEAKSFLAVYLQMASFACLLAAAAAEQIEHDVKADHHPRNPRDCRTGTSFLYPLLLTVLAVLIFSLRILFQVYLVNDAIATVTGGSLNGTGVSTAGGGDKLAFSCRAAVFLSLACVCSVILICIRLATSYQLFWGTPRRHQSSSEQMWMLMVLGGIMVTSLVLGFGGDPSSAALLWRERDDGSLDIGAINNLLDEIISAVASRC
jgi:hypothetical protein